MRNAVWRVSFVSLYSKSLRIKPLSGFPSDSRSIFNGCASLIAVSIPACPVTTPSCTCGPLNSTQSTSGEFRLAGKHPVASQAFPSNNGSWNSTHHGPAAVPVGAIPTFFPSGTANPSRALQVDPGAAASSGFLVPSPSIGGHGWNHSATNHTHPKITRPPNSNNLDGSRGRIPSCIPVGTCYDFMNKCRKRYGW